MSKELAALQEKLDIALTSLKNAHAAISLVLLHESCTKLGNCTYCELLRNTCKIVHDLMRIDEVDKPKNNETKLEVALGYLAQLLKYAEQDDSLAKDNGTLPPGKTGFITDLIREALTKIENTP